MSKRSEDELGEKWDRCLSDSLIKMGSGLGLGIVFSVIMFKRRAWPLTFGLGAGFGMSLANCQYEFNQPMYTRIYQLRMKELHDSATSAASSSSAKTEVQ